MKNRNLLLGIFFLVSFLAGCEDVFLDQEPQDSLTEVIYYKTSEQFQAGANYLHTCIYGWNGNTTYPINFDYGTDLNSGTGDVGSGNNTVASDDAYWNQTYDWLRHVNVFLSKVSAYDNKDEIAGPTGQAYFFRAWHHFFLLKRFGGVPIANAVTTVDSDIVWGARASRYQVMDQIINDLDSAILMLNKGNVTKATTNNDGQVTVEAAKALKARICLFEGTWEKYVGNTTDGDGSSAGAGTTGFEANKYKEYLTTAKNLAKELIDDGEFSLWKGVEETSSTANNDMYAHTSYFYLFNLEGSDSNPNGLDKSSNNEAVFRSVYDFSYRKGNTNLTHTKPSGVTRKLMDMYLCSDGLPVQFSPLFQGYATMTSEFENRDYRLTALVHKPMDWYWGYGKYNTGAQYGIDITTLSSVTYQNIPNITAPSGYSSRKFASENNARSDNDESADYMHIRFSEIYLIYAEATCELNEGEITDADLDYSINQIRERAGIAPLSHALIAPYSELSLLGEIRRERAIELHGEGHRISDLCRWGIAEDELANVPTCGVYLKSGGADTEYSTAINPNTGNPVLTPGAIPESNITQSEIQVSSYSGIAKTKAGAIISELASNRNFSRKNYLQPIPTGQIELNPNLTQNPEW